MACGRADYSLLRNTFRRTTTSCAAADANKDSGTLGSYWILTGLQRFLSRWNAGFDGFGVLFDLFIGIVYDF